MEKNNFKTDDNFNQNNKGSDVDNGNDTPSWLNKEYFQKYLQSEIKNFQEITWFSVRQAAQKGENYTSNLYRITVEIMMGDDAPEVRSYIIKVPLAQNEPNSFASLLHLYTKEIIMYNEILPRFEQLYRDQGVPITFAPKSYKLPDISEDNIDVDSILLLEDLSTKGFAIENRLEGLNVMYTKNALKKLAEFHAASVRYVQVYGPYPDIFNEHMFSEETRPLYENVHIDYFYDYVKEYQGHEEYIDKMPNLLENYLDLSITTSTTDPLEFNVLNHGDFWVNNIMFLKRDDDDHQLESCLIDFQLCKYGSPTLDLYMFLLSCTHLDIKITHFDAFIKYYHDQLVRNLKILQYEGEIPSLKELHASLLKYGFTGFGTVFNCLSLCLLDPSSAAEATLESLLDDSPDSEPIRKAMFLSDRFKAHAEVIMPWLANRGLLE